ncbi:MAG: hypothetical protein ABIJ35_11230 [Acidobacteriota bacterium]
MTYLWFGGICFLAAVLVFSACGEKSEVPKGQAEGGMEADILSPVPEEAQALSLFGEPLVVPEPKEAILEKYEAARAEYEALPDDPRFYRHQGHRYISIREFDRAIQDLKKAASLIKGTEDEIEPDGMPNEQNIPVSSLHTNIWYHLGLAYYLKHDLENALRVYRLGIDSSHNDDMLVATTHWLYMTLRLLGRDEEARQSLESIRKEMNVIENMAYHQLCLFYKGELSEDELTGDGFSSIMNDAVAYGLANYFFYSGDREKAGELYERILAGKVWASFGYIAAEADYHREFMREIQQPPRDHPLQRPNGGRF